MGLGHQRKKVVMWRFRKGLFTDINEVSDPHQGFGPMGNLYQTPWTKFTSKDPKYGLEDLV